MIADGGGHLRGAEVVARSRRWLRDYRCPSVKAELYRLSALAEHIPERTLRSDCLKAIGTLMLGQKARSPGGQRKKPK